MRVTQFAILSNHIHMIVEAECSSTLARGMQALTVRLARRINRATLRTGKLFVDRYHAHVLRTPREVRNAVRYVRENSRIHAERVGHAWTGETGRTIAGPRAERIPTASSTPVSEPTSWLLRQAWGFPPVATSAAGRQQPIETPASSTCRRPLTRPTSAASLTLPLF